MKCPILRLRGGTSTGILSRKREEKKNMFSYLLLLLNKGGSEKTNTSSRACSQEQPHWLTNTFPLKICEFSFLPHTRASAGNIWLPELSSSKVLKLFVKNVVDKQSGYWINLFYLACFQDSHQILVATVSCLKKITYKILQGSVMVI